MFEIQIVDCIDFPDRWFSQEMNRMIRNLQLLIILLILIHEINYSDFLSFLYGIVNIGKPKPSLIS